MNSESLSLQPRLLTLKQAAAYTSTNVWFWRSRIWAREIPFLLCGKKYLIDLRDLDRFIDAQKEAR